MGKFKELASEKGPSEEEIKDMQRQYAQHRAKELSRELVRLQDRMTYYGEGVSPADLRLLVRLAIDIEEVLA